MTGFDHRVNPQIEEAARWLAVLPAHEKPSPIIPELQRRFGLTAVEACKACTEANLMRARAH